MEKLKLILYCILQNKLQIVAFILILISLAALICVKTYNGTSLEYIKVTTIVGHVTCIAGLLLTLYDIGADR